MCLICMKYRIIILIIIIKRLGEILLSYIAHTSRTHTPKSYLYADMARVYKYNYQVPKDVSGYLRTQFPSQHFMVDDVVTITPGMAWKAPMPRH